MSRFGLHYRWSYLNRDDGALLAPDPSDRYMERRYIPAELRFLKIFDLDLDDDSGRLKQAPSFDGAAIASSGSIQTQPHPADLEGTLRALPSRARNTIRIYIEHGVSKNETYREHLKKDIFRDQNDRERPSIGGYEGLSNQWKKIPDTWFEILSFAFSETARTPRGNALLRVNEFSARFNKIAKEICVLEHEDGSLTCESYGLNLFTSRYPS